MTPAQFVRLLLASCVILMVWSKPLSAGDNHGKGRKANPRLWTKTVEGVPDKDLQVAQDTAVIKAQNALEEYLQTQLPRLRRVPSKDFILNHLLVDQKVQPLPDGKDQGKWLVSYSLKVDDERYKEIIQEEARLSREERDVRGRARMLALGKTFGVVIALLAALAGYLRLEEATKGYYTAWLRLGAISFVGAVGVGMWLAC